MAVGGGGVQKHKQEREWSVIQGTVGSAPLPHPRRLLFGTTRLCRCRAHARRESLTVTRSEFWSVCFLLCTHHDDRIFSFAAGQICARSPESNEILQCTRCKSAALCRPLQQQPCMFMQFQALASGEIQNGTHSSNLRHLRRIQHRGWVGPQSTLITGLKNPELVDGNPRGITNQSLKIVCTCKLLGRWGGRSQDEAPESLYPSLCVCDQVE